jgi:hypothetical protein
MSMESVRSEDAAPARAIVRCKEPPSSGRLLPRSTKISPCFHAAPARFLSCFSMRRAFVIQLREKADPAAGEFAGRVEHVDSGRADHFGSVEELVRFVERTLAEVETAEAGPPKV